MKKIKDLPANERPWQIREQKGTQKGDGVGIVDILLP